MNAIQQLENFLKRVVLPDLEQEIEMRFQEAQKEGMMSLWEREELKELQMMHHECVEMLVEIESEEMTLEEAEEITASLNLKGK